MIVVLPYCSKDLGLAIKLLDWIGTLDGGNKNPEVLLVSSQPVKPNEDEMVIASAKKGFNSVLMVKQPVADERGWPQSANALFRLAAEAMKQQRQPWLWLEPDATPTKAGWFRALDQEYARAKKPFMGAFHHRPIPHLNGVAVYPYDIWRVAPAMIRMNPQAFDCVSPHDCQAILKQSHVTPLIQHEWSPHGFELDSPARRFDKRLDGLRPDALIYHRCKDGSLIDCLRQLMPVVSEPTPTPDKKPGIIERIKTYFSSPDITVVITNYSRPDKVRHAFTSCLEANVKNVVISASGCGDDLAAMHRQFRKEKPDVVIDAIPDDLGCNEMWLRGVQLAKTKWVHLLHDDDMLLPEFQALGNHLNNGSSFFHWNGWKHAWPKSILDNVNLLQSWFPSLSEGVHDSKKMWPVLLGENNWSISPVAGLFTREHLIETLEEFERDYRDDRFFYKSRMQAGNDLLIWLRAVEKFPTFTFLTSPMVSYGHWDGSASFNDYGNQLGLLSKNYNATREMFLTGPSFDMLGSRPLVHIQTAFIGAEERERVKVANIRWSYQYRLGQWSRDVVSDEQLPRLFEDGKRKLPYVRDMIDLVVSRSSAGDPIFVFTNTDTIPVNSLTRHLLHAFKDHECAYSFRRDIKDSQPRTETSIRLQTEEYPGCDLFAFTLRWWKDNRKQFPDMLYATDAWDYCMRKLMDKSGGKRFFYLIYHTLHQGEWDRNKESEAHKHNHAQAEPFLRKMGLEPYWVSGEIPTAYTL